MLDYGVMSYPLNELLSSLFPFNFNGADIGPLGFVFYYYLRIIRFLEGKG